MKYILLIENDDGLPVGKICKNKDDLDNETCKVLYGSSLIDLPIEHHSAIQDDLGILDRDGRLDFEGDPSIQWAILDEDDL